MSTTKTISDVAESIDCRLYNRSNRRQETVFNLIRCACGKAPTMLTWLLASCIMAISAPVSANDWRVHLSICNQDPVCAKEQAAARDLWDKQNWSPDLKESCRKQYIQVYAKDYRGAVTCVSELEKQRQEFQLKQAEIDRKRNEQKTYRTWGGIIIK